MDYREILSVNLKSKSKKEIIEFLSNILGEYNATLEYGVLREVLSEEQIEAINKAIDLDNRAFAAEDPDFTEEDIQEWFQADSINRRLYFSKNEKGKTVLSDYDARMQDNPEITEIVFGDVDVAKLVELTQNGIEYTLGMGGTYDFREIDALQEELKYFSTSLEELNSIRRNFSSESMRSNALLNLMRITEIPFGIKDIEALMGREEAKKAEESIEEFLFSVYPENGISSPEINRERRDKARTSDDFYRVGLTGNRLALVGSPLPKIKFDGEKMADPEFSKILMGMIAKSYEKTERPSQSFYFEKLEELIGTVTQTLGTNDRDVDIKAFVQRIAQDPVVALMSEEAKTNFSCLMELGNKDIEIDEKNNGIEM